MEGIPIIQRNNKTPTAQPDPLLLIYIHCGEEDEEPNRDTNSKNQ